MYHEGTLSRMFINAFLSLIDKEAKDKFRVNFIKIPTMHFGKIGTPDAVLDFNGECVWVEFKKNYTQLSKPQNKFLSAVKNYLMIRFMYQPAGMSIKIKGEMKGAKKEIDFIISEKIINKALSESSAELMKTLLTIFYNRTIIDTNEYYKISNILE